jgi:hypothetical protein
MDSDDFRMFNVTSWMTVYFGNELYKNNDLSISLQSMSKQKYETRLEEMSKSKIPMSIDKYLNHIKILDKY